MRNVYLVCGPPCSGKSTWVEQRAQPNDLVADLDVIARSMGSPAQWIHPPAIAREADAVMADLEQQAADLTHGTAYIIRTMPRGDTRALVAEWLRAKVVLLDPGQHVCIDRAIGRPRGTVSVIRRWYRTFTPSPLDWRPTEVPTVARPPSPWA
jgi:predicted kinase